jgi:hypothetical protein
VLSTEDSSKQEVKILPIKLLMVRSEFVYIRRQTSVDIARRLSTIAERWHSDKIWHCCPSLVIAATSFPSWNLFNFLRRRRSDNQSDSRISKLWPVVTVDEVHDEVCSQLTASTPDIRRNKWQILWFTVYPVKVFIAHEEVLPMKTITTVGR